MWCRNSEGYKDYTAGIAISHASRNERKERNMAKKRSCRRTVDEDKIHEKAVKIRKMTDRVEKARSEGFHRGKEAAPAKPAVNIAAIIGEIGSVKGIGTTKLADIKAILKKHLGASNG